MEHQEQIQRSAVIGGERETAPQVEQAEGDGAPASTLNESQTDKGIRTSPLDPWHTESVLSSPHPIHDSNRVLTPKGVSGQPRNKTNYRYFRSFLRQAEAMCKDKPPTLGALDSNTQPAVTTAKRRKPRKPPALHTISVEYINQSPPATRGNNRDTLALPIPVVPIASGASSVDNEIQLPDFIQSALPEQVDTAVEGLLAKLDQENVDIISTDITLWANKSEEENDGRTLGRVVCLIFKNAIDDPTRSGMYARLCHKLRARISAKVRDDVNAQKIVGGWLFQTRLLTKCQQYFDEDWSPAGEGATVANLNTGNRIESTGVDDEAEPSDEHLATKQAKRLALIKFIGELFRVKIGSKRIIRKYAKKLVNASNPADQRFEGLCELLKQASSRMNTTQDRVEMDVYFRYMDELGKSSDISPHIRSMLQGVQRQREGGAYPTTREAYITLA